MEFIDLRSDTLSHPTPEMRQAMANAAVGDDVYGEHPTVNRLQVMAAEMLGKEDHFLQKKVAFGQIAQPIFLKQLQKKKEKQRQEINVISLYMNQ